MTANPISAAPAVAAGAVTAHADGNAGLRLARRVLFGLLILGALFVGTYGFAWYRAQSLATTFLADADKSYAAGNYINALTGYEDFNKATNTYVQHGGYMKVAKIWSDPHAWPLPAGLATANARINEILNQRLTIDDAEQFVQANTGKPNPYMGIVYLRLGELYEKSGDLQNAKQVYSDMPSLFPNEPDLVARAKDHLAKLGSK